MDEDDRPGYLMDYVIGFAKKHNITCGEDVYQSDDVALDAQEFMENCLEIAGVIEE